MNRAIQIKFSVMMFLEYVIYGAWLPLLGLYIGKKYLNFGDWVNQGPWNIEDHVRLKKAPKIFYESDDPKRLVPIVFEPDDFMIVVTGDPLRTNAYAFAPNGHLGYQVAKKIHLPKNWDSFLQGRESDKPSDQPGNHS